MKYKRRNKITIVVLKFKSPKLSKRRKDLKIETILRNSNIKKILKYMIIVNLVVIFQDDQTHFECSNNLKENKTKFF
jgi:hypothetical protein